MRESIYDTFLVNWVLRILFKNNRNSKELVNINKCLENVYSNLIYLKEAKKDNLKVQKSFINTILLKISYS